MEINNQDGNITQDKGEGTIYIPGSDHSEKFKVRKETNFYWRVFTLMILV
jgi:hypothetical protein